jgi:hypothetical protein
LHLTDRCGILLKGEIQKCQQKQKEKQTGCGSSAFLRITGTKSTKNGGKSTPPGKRRAGVPAAARNCGQKNQYCVKIASKGQELTTRTKLQAGPVIYTLALYYTYARTKAA